MRRLVRWFGHGFLLVAVLAGGWLAARPVAAQDTGVTGPTLTLSDTAVAPGEQVTVIFTGWQGRLVTLSVCGNLAKRGSADCNMPASQGVRLFHVDDTPLTAFVVSAPPGTCPCVIRASSDTGEVAYAPVDLEGVDVGPVVDPFDDAPPLELSVVARPDPDGVIGTLRSWLGGATPYELEITVHNQATEPFSSVRVAGAVGRDADTDLASYAVEPGVLGAGQTWTGTTRVEVPAPVIGRFEWRSVASGAGPVTETTTGERAVPWLLVVLVVALVADVVAVVVRFVSRTRRRRAEQRATDAQEAPWGEDHLPDDAPTDSVADDLVGSGQ